MSHRKSEMTRLHSQAAVKDFRKKIDGCPIHPTRVDSSLVFAIRQTGNRFVNPIPSNRHESFPLLSIRHAGSRFVRDLKNIVDLDFEGGLKMLSIRVDSFEATRIKNRFSCCRFVIPEVDLHASLFHGS